MLKHLMDVSLDEEYGGKKGILSGCFGVNRWSQQLLVVILVIFVLTPLMLFFWSTVCKIASHLSSF